MNRRLVEVAALASANSKAVVFYFDKKTTTPQALAILCEVLCADVPSYAFDYYVFNNGTFDEDNFFATYLDRVIVKPAAGESVTTALPLVSDPEGEVKRTASGAEFTLNVVGPRLVTSDEIEASPRARGFEIVPGQPLFYVREGEHVRVRMVAVLGSGRDNSKFSVVEKAFVNPDDMSVTLETTDAMTPRDAIDFALRIYPGHYSK